MNVFQKKGQKWNAIFKESDPDEYGQRERIPWTKEELDNFNKQENYLVADFHTVYKNDKDYAFKKLMLKLLDGRNIYKYTGSDVEAELIPYIDKLIEEKSKA